MERKGCPNQMANTLSKNFIFVRLLNKLLNYPIASLIILLAPPTIAVLLANTFAENLNAPVGHIMRPILGKINSLPQPINYVLGENYGIIAMLPFLLLYALPTVLVFSAIFTFYTKTGILNRASNSVNSLFTPFGIGGHDVIRIIMGFGCNVPAVIATRSCSVCTRENCISAISFGSACSYQLPATLAIFSAAGKTWLTPVYILVLAITTLIYIKFTKPVLTQQPQKSYKTALNQYLMLPNGNTIFREVIASFKEFINVALPIFILICFIAGLLQYFGFLIKLTSLLGPFMSIFNLPPDAALAVVLGSIRKDGLAVGLLNGDISGTKLWVGTTGELFTSVYLASVFLPCLITLLTIWREMKIKFAVTLVIRQSSFAIAFSIVIGWVSYFLSVI